MSRQTCASEVQFQVSLFAHSRVSVPVSSVKCKMDRPWFVMFPLFKKNVHRHIHLPDEDETTSQVSPRALVFSHSVPAHLIPFDSGTWATSTVIL